MKKSLFVLLGFVLMVISSCEYEFVEPLDVEFDGPISFSEQLEPVFHKKCATCHSSTDPILTTGNAYQSLIDGGYVNTQDPEASGVYEKTTEGHPGGSSSLSTEELAMLLQWIKEGAQDN